MRLQSKVLRFDLGMSPAAAAEQPQPRDTSGRNEATRAMIDELREENNQLHEDNDKLVEYLEQLEARLAQQGAQSKTASPQQPTNLDRTSPLPPSMPIQPWCHSRAASK